MILSGALFLVFALWLYYDWVDAKINKKEHNQSVYHCVKCRKIYVEKHDQEVAACPACQFKNARLKF